MNGKKQDNNKEKHLHLARDLAIEKLKAMESADICKRTGSTLRQNEAGATAINTEYLGKPLRIAVPDMTLSYVDEEWLERGGPVSLREEIYILHYLIGAQGTPPSGNAVLFRDMDGGMAYDSIFRARSVDRFVRAFRDREDLLTDIAGIFGGVPGEMGNVSVRLRVLPYAELVFVLWKGDDEIPSSGNIFFDDSISGILPTEDCVVMTETVVSRFIQVLGRNVS